MKQYIHWSILKPELEYPYILNLDLDFNPIDKGINLKYKQFTFKGGEPHFQIESECPYAKEATLIITQRYNKVDDIVNILTANDAARRMGFKTIKLVLPYFPAARQDRVCNDGEPLTVKVFTDMINACGFEEVIILCPHSEVTPALLNNVTVLDELKYVDKIMSSLDKSGRNVNIVCPDAGAGKRVSKVVQHLANNNGHVNFNLIRCEKVRDVKDGSLKDFFIQADDLGGYPTLIIDDINSMGGTFIGLGKKLREKNCSKLMLFTAHADCVEGVQNIIENFDHYYTTNSKQDWDKFKYTFDGRFTCMKIEI
jgi:ribose-phosphate pyrophosphokinase